MVEIVKTVIFGTPYDIFYPPFILCNFNILRNFNP
jgi:hypothetical protein